MAACPRVLFFVLVSLDRDGFMDGIRCTFSLVRVYKPGRHPGRCDSGTANQFIVLCRDHILYRVYLKSTFSLVNDRVLFVQALFWFYVLREKSIDRWLCFYDFIGSYGLFCSFINK